MATLNVRSEICLKVLWVSCTSLKPQWPVLSAKAWPASHSLFRRLVLSDPKIKDCVSGTKVLAGLVPEIMMALAGAEMRVVLFYFCSLCLA